MKLTLSSPTVVRIAWAPQVIRSQDKGRRKEGRKICACKWDNWSRRRKKQKAKSCAAAPRPKHEPPGGHKSRRAYPPTTLNCPIGVGYHLELTSYQEYHLLPKCISDLSIHTEEHDIKLIAHPYLLMFIVNTIVNTMLPTLTHTNIVLTIEPRMVNTIRHIVQSLSHTSFWCLFKDPHLTTTPHTTQIHVYV